MPIPMFATLFSLTGMPAKGDRQRSSLIPIVCGHARVLAREASGVSDHEREGGERRWLEGARRRELGREPEQPSECRRDWRWAK